MNPVLNPATKTTASKVIRYYQRELGPDRLTGGLLPTRNGLMVAVKPPPEPSTSRQQAAAANGNGSTPSPDSGTTLQALLIVPDRDAVRASLGEAIPDGHPIGPGGDRVTEQTRSDILTWPESELEPDGSLSESYVVSVAARLITGPETGDTAFEEALAEAQAAEAQAEEQAANTQAVEDRAAEEQQAAEEGQEALAEPRPAENGHGNADDATAGDPKACEADTTELEPATQPVPGGDEQQPARAEEAAPAEDPHAVGGEDQPINRPPSPDYHDQPEPDTQVDSEPAAQQPEVHDAPDEPGQTEQEPEPEPEAAPEICVPQLDGPREGEDGPETSGHPLEQIEQIAASESSTFASSAAESADYAGDDTQPVVGTGAAATAADDHDPETEETVQAHSAGELEQAPAPTDADPLEAQKTEDVARSAPAVPDTHVAQPAAAVPSHLPGKAGDECRAPQNAPEHGPDDAQSYEPVEDHTTARAALQYPAEQALGEPDHRDSDDESGADQASSAAAEDGSGGHGAGTSPELEDTDRQTSPAGDWLQEMGSGASPTPEQRAYYIGKQKASTLYSRLTFKRPPEEPPRLASISSPIQESAIARIANSRKGPGIVVPMISKGGTGKTTVAIELAFMLGLLAGAYGQFTAARTGKVLVVDMNITNPDLHRRLKVDGDGRMGLKDLLAGERLSRVVNRTVLPNVDAMFLLGVGDNDKGDLPRAMKDPNTMEAIIKTVANRGGYDMIVVDTANTMPAEEDNEASYSLTMWALAADARYLILQPEKASFENGAWFADSLARALGDDASTVPILNSFPVNKVYSEAPITKKMAANRRYSIQAIRRMQAAKTNYIVPAIGQLGDELTTPLFVPDYPEEVRSFAAEGRPLCMYSQTFSNAYERIALDAVRRMLDNRKPD